ncbi:hypothetical protein NPIL_103801 [Nephila pilipes]|uniref:Uncharacterized protein n=1 Tax=Nephila pilipes TaxID=299642 RepID=A0A8X6PES9_NEPPI|nr:hypothetical protein NPIL_103801 [Nephila pilipes]
MSCSWPVSNRPLRNALRRNANVMLQMLKGHPPLSTQHTIDTPIVRTGKSKFYLESPSHSRLVWKKSWSVFTVRRYTIRTDNIGQMAQWPQQWLEFIDKEKTFTLSLFPSCSSHSLYWRLSDAIVEWGEGLLERHGIVYLV